MNKFVTRCLKRLLPLGLAASAAAAMLVPAAANATPYVVTLRQQGGNVVATGSGEFDLTGLELYSAGGYTFTFPAWIYPSEGGGIGLGSTTERIDSYNGGSGPANFGMGGGTAGSGSGDPVAGGFGSIDVPTGYSSGTQLSDNATWANASFASLGVTPGTYVWTWGTGADQSYTLDIADAPVGVPEPASLGMFGLGVLLLGAFVERRRRMV